jgi:hypothetical protein
VDRADEIVAEATSTTVPAEFFDRPVAIRRRTTW